MKSNDHQEEKVENKKQEKADPDEILEKLNSILEYLKNPMLP